MHSFGLGWMKQKPYGDGLNPWSARINTDPNSGKIVLVPKKKYSAIRIFFFGNKNLTWSRNEMAMQPVKSALAIVPMYKKKPCAVHVPVFPAA